MLRAFTNAFKIPELRGKILFTLAIIAVYRFGSFVPIPGVDYNVLQQALGGIELGGAQAVVNLFSGGALTQLAVFALGIMPYITSSIIMQLLTVVIPKLEEWKKEGETGTKRITQFTRYLTIVLALLQATGLLVLIGNAPEQIFGFPIPGLIPDNSIPITALQVLTLTAGTAFIMWLGELVTARGIGNGMSLLIFASIISQLPSNGQAILGAPNGEIILPIALLTVLLLTVAVVFVEQGQRRIPVQYAKRQVGRRAYGGSSTYIPLKVNQAGIIPIIFASSLLYLPQLASTIVGDDGFTNFVNVYLSGQGSFVDSLPYILLMFALVIFFAYFYTAITFNPIDVADNMKKYGGFIPGIRPGRPTAEYLDKVLTRITLPGSLYLGVLAILPIIVLTAAGVNLPLLGSSLLIVVGVGLETMKQLESQLMQRHYEGFLKS